MAQPRNFQPPFQAERDFEVFSKKTEKAEEPKPSGLLFHFLVEAASNSFLKCSFNLKQKVDLMKNQF